MAGFTPCELMLPPCTLLLHPRRPSQSRGMRVCYIVTRYELFPARPPDLEPRSTQNYESFNGRLNSPLARVSGLREGRSGEQGERPCRHTAHRFEGVRRGRPESSNGSSKQQHSSAHGHASKPYPPTPAHPLERLQLRKLHSPRCCDVFLSTLSRRFLP